MDGGHFGKEFNWREAPFEGGNREDCMVWLWYLSLAHAQWNACANEVRAEGWFEQLGVVSQTSGPAKCQTNLACVLKSSI